MSAFMVDDGVFAQVARFLKEDRPDILSLKYADLNLDPVTFVEILRVLNRESIRTRYPSEIDKPWMLSNGSEPKEREYAPIDPLSVGTCSPTQAAQHLDCIAYQACETPRWEASGVGALVEKIATDIGGARGDDPRYGKGQGRRALIGESRNGRPICRETGAELTYGRMAEPPPPPPPKLPDGWRDGQNQSKVLRKDTLRKLAEDGSLELVDSYAFDDMYGQSGHDGPPKPVKYVADGSAPSGFACLRPFHIEPCRQWRNQHGRFIHLRIHSNHNMTFRVVEGARC